MLSKDNVKMSEMWRGEGVSDDRDVLLCPAARFIVAGVRRGDVLDMSRGEVSVRAAVIQVVGEESLMFQVLGRPNESEQSSGLSDMPPGEVTVVLSRVLEDPCQTCDKLFAPREQDHIHCPGCNAVVPFNPAGIINCPACIEGMIQRLIGGVHVENTVPIFNGKRTITIHAKTVGESDEIQEWQDAVMSANKNFTTQYILDETKKAAVAIAVNDDGHGKSPRDLCATLPPEATPIDRITVMMKHFKSFPAAYFNAVMVQVGQLDALLEDACKYAIKDEPSEEELMVLGEQVAIGPYPVLGRVSLWDGKVQITFTSPSLEAIDDANAFAENFIQAHKSRMFEGRAKFIVSFARLVAHFRGDHMTRFGEDSTFDERLDYLMSIPMSLYYLYLAAGNVWQHRLNKSSETSILGKS